MKEDDYCHSPYSILDYERLEYSRHLLVVKKSMYAIVPVHGDDGQHDGDVVVDDDGDEKAQHDDGELHQVLEVEEPRYHHVNEIKMAVDAVAGYADDPAVFPVHALDVPYPCRDLYTLLDLAPLPCHDPDRDHVLSLFLSVLFHALTSPSPHPHASSSHPILLLYRYQGDIHPSTSHSASHHFRST